MINLYKRSPLAFSLVWIGIYVIGTSLGEELSGAVGVESSVVCLVTTAISILLFFLLKRLGLLEHMGLCPLKAAPRELLWLIPLAIVTTRNLWGGVGPVYTPLGSVCFVIKMLGVGFLEELIFRGLLFRAMEKDSFKWAVIVSSVTFGMGHILNLFNGTMAFGDNLFQIISATVFGFMYVLVFLRSGSLIPCIVSHGIFNSLSALQADTVPPMVIRLCDGIMLAIVAGYSLYLWKTGSSKLKKAEAA